MKALLGPLEGQNWGCHRVVEIVFPRRLRRPPRRVFQGCGGGSSERASGFEVGDAVSKPNSYHDLSVVACKHFGGVTQYFA